MPKLVERGQVCLPWLYKRLGADRAAAIRLRQVIIALIVMLPGLILRFYGLKWGLPDSRHFFSYHPDEFYMVGGVLNMDLRHLDLNPDFFNYGTLFIYLMAATAAIAKLFVFPQTDAAWMALYVLSGRIVSALLGSLTIGLVFLTVRRLGGLKAALLSALLLTFWPMHLVHSHFATVDITAAFFTALTLWLCSKVYTGQDGAFFWAALAAGLAAAARYNAGLVLIAVPAALWLRPRTYARPELRRWLSLPAGVCLGFFIGCPYALLTPTEFVPAVRHAQRLIASGLGDLFDNTPPGWIYHLKINLVYGLGWPAAVTATAAAVHGLCHAKGRVLLIWAALFYLLIGAAQVKFMRYMLPLTPALAATSGLFLESLLDKARGRWRPAAVAAVSFVLIYTVVYGLAFALLPGRPDGRDVIAARLDGAEAGSSVAAVHTPDFSTPPFMWYNGGKVAPGLYQQARSECRFRLETVSFDAGVLRRLDDTYLVLSEYDYREIARQHPEKFVQCMSAINERYRLVEAVAAVPSLGPLRFRKGFPPHDLLYVYPETRLYRRKE